MLEVHKKEKESSGALLRRFTRKIHQSRILLEVRKNRFKEKTRSRREKRQAALRRKKKREEKRFLRKLGILKEETRGRRWR